MKKLRIHFLLLLTALASIFTAGAQPAITGPTCVISGTVYQYIISGPWDSTSTMHVCATGATFTGTTGACTSNGSPVSFVLVVWSDSSASGSLSLTSSSGNSTLAVNITRPLTAGHIDTGIKAQSISYDSLSVMIRCAVDTGGSCSPSYMHQWQQSFDRLQWTDVSGAAAQNLDLSAPLLQTTFYRRRTTETVSGSIVYSDIAAVYVGPPPPTALDNITGNQQVIATLYH